MELAAELRATVQGMLTDMRHYFDRCYTPRAKPGKACANCSLSGVCLPKLPQEGRVAAYIQKALMDDAHA